MRSKNRACLRPDQREPEVRKTKRRSGAEDGTGGNGGRPPGCWLDCCTAAAEPLPPESAEFRTVTPSWFGSGHAPGLPGCRWLGWPYYPRSGNAAQSGPGRLRTAASGCPDPVIVSLAPVELRKEGRRPHSTCDRASACLLRQWPSWRRERPRLGLGVAGELRP